ncbi:DUF2284 domain-containing protein [Thermodesulfobacteriota bacterium]
MQLEVSDTALYGLRQTTAGTMHFTPWVGWLPQGIPKGDKERIVEDRFRASIDKAVELGASGAKLIAVEDIVMDRRSLLKCRFGCNRWGRFWTCQPNMGMSFQEFMQTLACYQTALVISTKDPKVSQEVTLAVEKHAMLELGALYAFALALCVACDECAYPDPCRYPHLARPSLDGLGVDVMKTVEQLGFRVEFDPGGSLLPSWYSMVLLD